jgi:hypothetical protein
MTTPSAPPARRGRRLSAPVLLSAAAAVISVIALVVSLAAYAKDTGETANAAPAGTTSTPTGDPQPAETAEASPTGEPTDDADTTEEAFDPLATDAPLPSGGAPYTLFKEDVRISLTGSHETRYIDLDQPLVNADSPRYEVWFSATAGKPELRFESVKVAQAGSPAVTPDECASDIQLSPTDQTVELSQDLVLCTVTNGIGAPNEPSRPKMARIVVNSIKDDGGTALTITTWEIPH